MMPHAPEDLGSSRAGVNHVFLTDVDNDGCLDANVSDLSEVVWPVLFCRNHGSPNAAQAREIRN